MARISVEAIRRRQLVDVALALIAEKGYAATTIRDIAGRADVATGTVAYYFAGRDDVLRAALREAGRRFAARLQVALAVAATPTEQLLAHVAAATPRTGEERTAQAVWLELAAQARRDPLLAAEHARLYDGWRGQIARVAAAAGIADAAGFAVELVALIDGLALHVLLSPASVSADAMAAILGRHITATCQKASAHAPQ